jgi:hypothetical protein
VLYYLYDQKQETFKQGYGCFLGNNSFDHGYCYVCRRRFLMFGPELHTDEVLLEQYHKHELTLLPKLFRSFILLFIPWFLGFKYDAIHAQGVWVTVLSAWSLGVLAFAIHDLLVWKVNVYVLSSKRLIHVAHNSLFKKTVNETPLDRILNVSFKTTGLFSTLFRYGDVLVQIVGLDQPLVLRDVPHPSIVKDYIWKIHLDYGGDQKITYTQPEIAPVDKNIPYAPNIEPKRLIKIKQNVSDQENS